jgi:hypothetical protein
MNSDDMIRQIQADRLQHEQTLYYQHQRFAQQEPVPLPFSGPSAFEQGQANIDQMLNANAARNHANERHMLESQALITGGLYLLLQHQRQQQAQTGAPQVYRPTIIGRLHLVRWAVVLFVLYVVIMSSLGHGSH